MPQTDQGRENEAGHDGADRSGMQFEWIHVPAPNINICLDLCGNQSAAKFAMLAALWSLARVQS
jgi:hypothetical protein